MAAASASCSVQC